MNVYVFADRLRSAVEKSLGNRQAIYQSRPQRPDDADVVVYALPIDGTGYQFLSSIREDNPASRTVIVTDSPAWQEATSVLRGGAGSLAFDYLDVGDGRFTDRLTKTIDDMNIVAYGGLEVSLTSWVTHWRGQQVNLTQIESQVLSVFLRKPNQGLDYTEIAYAVYGERLSIDDGRSRLRTHIWMVRRKLQAVIGKNVIINRGQVGYVLVI